MTEAEFYKTKSEIENIMKKAETQVRSLSFEGAGEDEGYLAKLSKLIVIKKLQDTSSDFDYYQLAKVLGRKPIRDFIKTIVNRIYIDHNNVTQIVFKNEMRITFIY